MTQIYLTTKNEMNVMIYVLFLIKTEGSSPLHAMTSAMDTIVVVDQGMHSKG